MKLFPVHINQSPPFCGSLIPFFISDFLAVFQSCEFDNYCFVFLLTQWHAPIRSASMLKPSFSKIATTLSYSVTSFASLGIPTISRHSLLEYWAFAQHWHSVSTSLPESRLLAFSVIHTSDWILSNLSFNLRNLSSNSVLELLTLSSFFCKDKTIGIKFFLYNLSSDLLV